MKKIVGILAISVLLIGCGEKKKEEKRGFEFNRGKTDKKSIETSEGVPVDMDNEGIGPFKNITFPAEINADLVTIGKAKYDALCTACHMPSQRLIGPPLSGVYEIRNVTWVMNMIANPTEMIKKDPIAKALLKDYNNAIMLNNNLSEQDTRAIAEFLRTL